MKLNLLTFALYSAAAGSWLCLGHYWWAGIYAVLAFLLGWMMVRE